MRTARRFTAKSNGQGSSSATNSKGVSTVRPKACYCRPGLLRETIDQDIFFAAVRSLPGLEIDEQAKGAEADRLRIAELTDHLIATVERIFPGAGRRLAQPTFMFGDSSTDAGRSIAAWIRERCRECCRAPATDRRCWWLRCSAELSGAGPTLSAEVAERLLEVAFAVVTDKEVIARCVSEITEILNKVSSARLGAWRLRSTPDNALTEPGFGRSRFPARPQAFSLNELGRLLPLTRASSNWRSTAMKTSWPAFRKTQAVSTAASWKPTGQSFSAARSEFRRPRRHSTG